MNFILEQQAASTVRHAQIEENFKKLQQKLDGLAEISGGLLSVAQIRSRRLDRLEGIPPGEN